MCVVFHSWQEAGIGVAPFALRTVISLPPRSLASENPSVYEAAMRDISASNTALGISLGSCNVCGTSLRHNYVITGADGKNFVVGSDCVEKSGDSELISAVEAEERRRAEQDRREALLIKETARMDRARAAQEAERERNGGLTDYELEEKKLAERRASNALANGWIVEFLGGDSDFVSSIRRELSSGVTLAANLPPRALEIIADIYLKDKGLRRNSRQWEPERDSFFERVEAMKSASIL